MSPANGVQLPANNERRRLDTRRLVFDMIVERILEGLQHTNVASLAILLPGDGDEGLGGELAILPPANEVESKGIAARWLTRRSCFKSGRRFRTRDQNSSPEANAQPILTVAVQLDSHCVKHNRL